MNTFHILKAVRDHSAKAILRVIYSVIKPCVRLNPSKVLFLSRHANSETLDFRLLREELQAQNQDLEIISIARQFEGRMREIPAFTWAVLRSLVHMASAKVCVLDSYWPGVSLLDHRPELKIYQMWHSLGKVKRTGRQAVGQVQGRATELANILQMHEGYDYVVAGGTFWNEHYRETFGVEKHQVLHLGLPRADYLVKQRDEIAARIFAAYPELKRREIVLYAPTFRRKQQTSLGAQTLAPWVCEEQYSLIVKAHKDDEMAVPRDKHILTCSEFSGFELLTVADYVVTDYSSIALEAALIDVPTYYYVYDHDDYLRGNGVNIDLFVEMPGCVFTDAEELAQALQRPYPLEALQRYKEKYLFESPGESAQKFATHILEIGMTCGPN